MTGSLTLEECVALLSGNDFWTTVAIARVGLRSIRVSDGPNGVRGDGGLTGGTPSTCFPSAISLAATWDVDLVRRVGEAIAYEARDSNVDVLLAPTVNMHRSPLNGRNFECYSEDPILSANIGVAYIEGVQSTGVAAVVKHFVGNDSEFERRTISSNIGERALREIYLPPFEAAVKSAGVKGVMTGYNRLNGIYCSEHSWLLRQVLREEWTFDGVVFSDWFGMHSTEAPIHAGLDLEMPGPSNHRGAALLDAVRDGRVSERDVRQRASAIIRLINWLDEKDFEAGALPEMSTLNREVAAAGIVMLKNDGLLPLDEGSLMRIAVIGPLAATAQIMGGGSAQLHPRYVVSPLDGLRSIISGNIRLDYEEGCSNARFTRLVTGSIHLSLFDNPDLQGDPVEQISANEAEFIWFDAVRPGIDPRSFSAHMDWVISPAHDGIFDFGLISAGRSRLFIDGILIVENWDNWVAADNYFGAGSNEVTGMLSLEAGQNYKAHVDFSYHHNTVLDVRAVRVGMTRRSDDTAFDRAIALARDADVVLLCVGANGEWDIEGRDRPGLALPGRQDELITRISAVNPRCSILLQSGGPVAMPWVDQVSSILQAWYPGQECGHAIADVLFGRVSPSGRLPQTFPKVIENNPAFGNYPGSEGCVSYEEDIFIGYRHYDRANIEPLYAFGHGLSYAEFAYENIALSKSENEWPCVSIRITNNSLIEASEVVQLYVRHISPEVARPHKELKAFRRVKLMAGAQETVQFSLDFRSFAYFSESKSAWVAEAAHYEVLVGSSSIDIRASVCVTIADNVVQYCGATSEKTNVFDNISANSELF